MTTLNIGVHDISYAASFGGRAPGRGVGDKIAAPGWRTARRNCDNCGQGVRDLLRFYRYIMQGGGCTPVRIQSAVMARARKSVARSVKTKAF
jgi:hypothetical protein